MRQASDVLRCIRSHADVVVFALTWTAALVVYVTRGLSPLFPWLATALLMVGGWVIYGRSARIRDSWQGRVPGWFVAVLPYVLATAVVLISLGPLLLSQPINQDHAHHYMNTAIQVDLIRSGHLFGWTDRVSTGLPFGDLYGTGVYLTTAALTLLSAGWIPLDVSYTAGFIAAWLVPALAVVAWSRRLGAGPVGATLAASAFALDPGGDREGGWLYSFFHGVWPQFFATGLLMWGLLALARLVEKPTTRRLAAAVLLMGSSVWAHPMNAVNLAIVSALFLGVLPLASPDEDRGEIAPLRAVGWTLAAVVLSGVVAMGWFSHLLQGDDSMVDHTAYWQPLSELGDRMLWGAPFDNHVVIVGILALVGLLACVRRARLSDTWVVAMIVVLLVIGSMDLLISLDLGISSKHQLFMYRRLSMTVKPLWFAAAGVGATQLFRGLASHPRPGNKWLRVAALVAVAPIVAATVGSMSTLVRSPAGRPLTVRNAQVAGDLAAVSAHLSDKRNRVGGGPLRVGYLRAHGEHGEYALLPFAEQGFGYVPNQPPPCQTFVRMNTVASLQALRWLGASLAVTHGSQKVRGATLLGTYGTFKVYDLGDNPTYPVSIKGAGSFQVLDWRPMYRRLRLEGVNEASELVLGFPYYKKWKATAHGASVPVRSSTGKGVRHATSVTGLRDGEIELVFKDTSFEKASLVACLLVVLAGLAGLFAPARPLPWLIEPRRIRYVRGLVLGLAVLGAVTLVVVTVRLRSKALSRTWGEPGRDVLSVLHQQRPSAFSYAPWHYCVRPHDRNPRPGCSEAILEPTLVAGPRRGNNIPACLRLGVPDQGNARIDFELPEGTTVVRGRLHRVHASVSSVEVVLGERVHELGAVEAFRLETGGARHVTFRFENGGSTAQVCLELVALGP